MEEEEVEEFSPRGASDGAPPSVEQPASTAKDNKEAPKNTRVEIVEVMDGL